MTTTPEKQPNNCKKGIHADGMCYCLEDKPTPEAEGIEERRKFIEVFYKDFNDYNDIDVKFEDVYQYHHHQLQKAREERDAVEKAYQAGISKIADELQGAGFVKTADLIRRDLARLEANPTVENVMNDDHSELDQDSSNKK